MACICKNGWTNTACRECGVDDGSNEPLSPADQVRAENDR